MNRIVDKRSRFFCSNVDGSKISAEHKHCQHSTPRKECINSCEIVWAT